MPHEHNQKGTTDYASAVATSGSAKAAYSTGQHGALTHHAKGRVADGERVHHAQRSLLDVGVLVPIMHTEEG
jgi:hypothetical protein